MFARVKDLKGRRKAKAKKIIPRSLNFLTLNLFCTRIRMDICKQLQLFSRLSLTGLSFADLTVSTGTQLLLSCFVTTLSICLVHPQVVTFSITSVTPAHSLMCSHIPSTPNNTYVPYTKSSASVPYLHQFLFHALFN